MVEEKKITEIIQEIKSEVTEVLAYIKNINFKYDLILDRLNKLVAGATSKSIAPSIPTEVETSELIFPEYQSPFENTSNLKSKIQLALEQAQKDQELEDQVSKEIHQDGKRRNLRQHAESQMRQIPTQQRIIYPDQKPVYMANVEIFDINSKLVKQTKTNQVGKWLASLASGEYQIKISKAGGPLKPKVEMEYRILIPNQDSAVDLGTKTTES